MKQPRRGAGVLLAAACLVVVAVAAEETVWLSDLPLGHWVQEWRAPQADKAVSGGPLTIAGTTYAKGVGSHAHSRALFELAGRVLRFEAKVGVDDGMAPPGEKATWGGTVVFRVLADGRERWETKIRWDRKAVPVKVDLAGVNRLELIVEPDQDGNGRDHADWADAWFVVDGGTITPVEQVPTVPVVVRPDVRFQTFAGFGEGSMGQGYARVFSRYSPTVRERYLDAIYTERDGGLALQIARANVAVGDHPEHAHMDRRPWGKLNPNGWETADGRFDTANHEAELWMYRGAQDRGATMLYFWNGPPHWLTVSGCSSGSLDGKSDNLPAGREPRFAKHIVDVLALFRDTYSLRADLVCPINEPEAGWWRGGEKGSQEGCHTSAGQAVAIFRELRRELDARGMGAVGIVGPEAAYGNGAHYGKAIFAHREAKSCLAAVSVHQYITSPWGYEGWRDVARDAGLPLWQSEWGNWHLPKDADARRRQHHALSYGRQIHDALTRYPAVAWCMWEPDNLFDLGEGDFGRRPAFHLMAQYSRAIRPGMVRILAADETLRTVCFLDPGSRRFAIVTLNDTLTDRTVAWDLGGFAAPTVLSCVRSGPGEEQRPVAWETAGGSVRCPLPAFSVATVCGRYQGIAGH